jgi:signal transduction histidine kinase
VQVLLDQIRDTGLTADQERLVVRAQSETDRITRTFRSMLQIARIEGGGTAPSLEAVDLNEISETMVSVYEGAAEEARQALILHQASVPATVRGDRSLLQQVLANLIENAIRHCPAGSRITVALDASGPVVLTVADNGPGIPEGEREKVLRRLYRLERSRTTEGSGLGLSLVAAVCDLHGANLELGDAAPGLTVTITFPA